MIKIINEVDGKKYELVKEKLVCDGCSFKSADYDCLLPWQQKRVFGVNVCGRLGGIWKEVEGDKNNK